MKLWPATSHRAEDLLHLLRITICLLAAIHGWTRFTEGHVLGFGRYLAQLGVPLGVLAGVLVSSMEAFVAPLLATGRLGRLNTPLALGFALIYTVGIFIYHWPNGWFSAGHDDGCEYPTLMVLCFGLVAWFHADAWRRPEALQRQAA